MENLLARSLSNRNSLGDGFFDEYKELAKDNPNSNNIMYAIEYWVRQWLDTLYMYVQIRGSVAFSMILIQISIFKKCTTFTRTLRLYTTWLLSLPLHSFCWSSVIHMYPLFLLGCQQFTQQKQQFGKSSHPQKTHNSGSLLPMLFFLGAELISDADVCTESA